MNKDLTNLVGRLERAFPHLKLYYEGESFHSPIRAKSIEKEGPWENDFAPPQTYNWYEFIQLLKENGLEIRNIKE